MNDSIKATRATIQIGTTAIDAFMLPDGGYRMSLTQAAECIGLGVQNASDFLRSKAIKGLLGDGYTPQIFEIEPDATQSRGQSRIRALPLEVVSAYWLWQSHRGNKTALALCMALIVESLERRFDTAFGVIKAEQEYNDRLAERLDTLEQDLQGSMDFEAIASYERNYLEEKLRQYGIDPWALPTPEGEG